MEGRWRRRGARFNARPRPDQRLLGAGPYPCSSPWAHLRTLLGKPRRRAPGTGRDATTAADAGVGPGMGDGTFVVIMRKNWRSCVGQEYHACSGGEVRLGG